MRRVERIMIDEWRAAETRGERLFPYEFFYRVLRRPELIEHCQIPLADSWLVAAMERDLPIFVPGWEDSTLGNMFAAQCIEGHIQNPHTVRSGVKRWSRWRSGTRAKRPNAQSVSFKSVAGSPAIFRSAPCRC